MSYDTIMNLEYYIFENLLERYSKILDERKKEKESLKKYFKERENFIKKWI